MLNKLAAALKMAQTIGQLENTVLGVSRFYHWSGRFVQWNENIPRDIFTAMKERGEVVVLLNEKGEPHSALSIDALGTMRESTLN